MEYPCAKFGDFNFSRFGFIIRKDRDRQNHTQTRMNAILIKATPVGVSKSRWVPEMDT